MVWAAVMKSLAQFEIINVSVRNDTLPKYSPALSVSSLPEKKLDDCEGLNEPCRSRSESRRAPTGNSRDNKSSWRSILNLGS